MKNIKKWLAAAGAGLAVIAMTAVAMPAGTVSAAAAQNGRGPGGQADTYLADALGVMIVITDLQGRPVTRSSNAPGLIRAIEAHPGAYAQCLSWWATLTRRPGLQPAMVASNMGLLCTRAFIRMGSGLVGMVVFGGVAPQLWPPSAYGDEFKFVVPVL